MADTDSLSALVVNERFWLKWGRDAILGSSTARAASAEGLRTTVGWLWTVYAAVAVFGTALADRGLFLHEKVLILLPTALLVPAYLVANWSSQPINVEFDQRSPRECEDASKRVVRAQRFRSTLALTAAVIAAAGVIASGVTAALARTSDGAEFAFHVLDRRQPDGSHTILVDGRFPKNQEVVIRVAVDGDASATTEQLHTADSDGSLRTTLSAPPGATRFDVTAEWTTEDEVKRTASKVFEVKGAGAATPTSQ